LKTFETVTMVTGDILYP